jgi:hypothetical protein
MSEASNSRQEESASISADEVSNVLQEPGSTAIIPALHEQNECREEGVPENFNKEAPSAYDVLEAVGSPANAVKSIRKKKAAKLLEF